MEIRREWCMPNKNTFSIKPIRELIDKYIKTDNEQVVIDPFANTNKIATITNDLNPEYDTDYHLDATDFLKQFEPDSVDAVLYDPPYCYDGETEILTKRGWISVKDVCMEDLIATLTPEGYLEYNYPQEVIRKKYKGNMVSIENKNVSLLVTPNHRCYAMSDYGKDFDFVEANDLFNDTDKHWFLRTCKWAGLPADNIVIPAAGKQKERVVNMDLWLKFVGLYYSMGHIVGNRINLVGLAKRGSYKVLKVLDELNIDYKRNEKFISIRDEQIVEFMKGYDTIPEFIKGLSSEKLAILANHMFYESKFKTKNINLVNDISEIALKAGIAITVITYNEGKSYIVKKVRGDFVIIRPDQCTKDIPYDDYIYCVTVPNSIVLVKRNGKIFWCGNSPRQVSECYKELGQTVNMQTTQASYWSKHKEQIGKIVKKGGYVITCSWNSGGIGKKYGFEIVEILLVPHGGWHNDTIVVVEKKVK